MDPLKLAVMMGVAVPVEHVRLAKSAAVGVVCVPLTVLGETAVMTDVEETPVESVHQPKLVQMVFAWEQLLLNVPEEFVDPIELEEVAGVVLLVKDAVSDNASVIMTVMREIVELRSNLKEPILVSVLKDRVDHAPMDSPADQMEDAHH